MNPRLFSRRRLLGSSTALLAVGMIFTGPTAAEAQMPASVSAMLNTLLGRLQGALPSLLTEVQAAIGAGGGLAHGGKVRRIPMPAFLKDDANPHFRPIGPAFSAAEQAAFKPPARSGGGV